MINQQWLHTFLTLVEVGHFTQTAEKLHMTQPGVSQHIKKLEQQAGTQLLQRIGKRFELTRAGELMYQFGCKRRQEENELFNTLQYDDPHQGECRIACSGSMAMLLYTHFLERQSRYPELAISLEAAPNHRIIDSINQNEIDLGIVTQPLSSPVLEQELIGHESLCLILPGDHRDKPLTVDILDALGFINHPDGEHYADRLLSANFADSFQSIKKLKTSGYVNQLGQILLPVSRGLGFTVLPETAVLHTDLQSQLYIAPLENPVRDELFLLKKRHRSLPSRYQWFEQAIKELVR